MKEVLIENGFQYLGDCMICRGQYEDWSKVVNGKDVLIKIKKDGRRVKIVWLGKSYWLQYGAGSNMPMNEKLLWFLKDKQIISNEPATTN